MKLVKIRAKQCPSNVLEVDQSNADALIRRGTWELVPVEKAEEGQDVDGSKPAGRGRPARKATPST